MKPLVLCLFAVCCWWVAEASADTDKQRRKLLEVRRQLKEVKAKLQVGLRSAPPPFCRPPALFTLFTLSALSALQTSEKMLSTPAENIQVRTTFRPPLQFCSKATCNICGRLVIAVGVPPSASAAVGRHQTCVQTRFYLLKSASSLQKSATRCYLSELK